ncbi:MAG TPA: sulfatase-like hydrolase/transferase [Solirubrobacterales bacterium]|jgi:arylsulfatase A-like enzyme|nr:sulfatase-like hydrolase/transferase [Solirubrobacterales bacterium]
MHRSEQSRAGRGIRLAVIAAGMLALLCLLATAGFRSSAAAATPERPSFVVIQTDDQTLDQLYAAFGQPKLQAMPNTLNLIAKRGETFNRYYVSYPLCCPSRVSLLTGRYAHNNGVKGNIQPNGGYFGFSFRGAYTHNIATWLQGAGYRTIHVGKFLNGYGDEPYSNGTEVPPGWSAWHTVLNADTDHYYYGYKLNNNGVVEGPYGDSGTWEPREYTTRDDVGCPFAPLNGQPCFYETDMLTNLATQELRNTPEEQPFYLQLDYTAPHGDFRKPAGPEPAPRHYDWFKGAPLPHNRGQGFDEGNVSDKPSFIREAPYLGLSEIHTYRVYYDKALESLRSVDDGVKLLVDTLGSLHRLRNTYIIFTSDNGFFYGEHRLLGGKFLAYEPSTHLPFLIRGPGIKPGSESGEIVGNIDIAPTVLELAGVTPDKSVDGRSMKPFFEDPNLRTLRPYLFESFVETDDVNEAGAIAEPGDQSRATREQSLAARQSGAAARPGGGASASLLAPPKDYEGIRLGPYKYIAWPDGEKELYDLETDPYELNNLVRIPNYFPVRNFLHRELTEHLEDCSGRTCREEVAELPLTRRERQQVIRQVKAERREKQQHKREEQRQKHPPKR